MKIKYLLLPFALIFILPLAAQDASGQAVPGQAPAAQPSPEQIQPGPAVFAPFVTRLQGEVKNNLIRLSWTDSPDIRGPVFIYRSSLPFDTGNTVTTANAVEVPYGVQFYVDEIESPAAVYYFAAASDETGRRYDMPIAFTNTIAVRPPPGAAVPESTSPAPVSPVQAPSLSQAAPTATAPVSPPAALPSALPAAKTGDSKQGVSSLQALAQGDKVIITFTGPEGKSPVLYRGTRPITSTQDLLGAIIVQTKISSPFTDYPAPLIPYYYAVIAEEDITQGSVEIRAGLNATSTPVQVSAAGSPGTDTSGREIRAMPLPQISAQAVVPGAGTASDEASRRMEISPQAAQALSDVPARPSPDPALKRPRVFAGDLEAPPGGGEEYALSMIVKGSFMGKNWEAARDELAKFIALPRKSEVNARAKFYLGQCYYYLKQYREGLFEFLAIQDRYPAEAMEWIQASLDAMKS